VDVDQSQGVRTHRNPGDQEHRDIGNPDLLRQKRGYGSNRKNKAAREQGVLCDLDGCGRFHVVLFETKAGAARRQSGIGGPAVAICQHHGMKTPCSGARSNRFVNVSRIGSCARLRDRFLVPACSSHPLDPRQGFFPPDMLRSVRRAQLMEAFSC